jgi:hypothetical protein
MSTSGFAVRLVAAVLVLTGALSATANAAQRCDAAPGNRQTIRGVDRAQGRAVQVWNHVCVERAGGKLRARVTTRWFPASDGTGGTMRTRLFFSRWRVQVRLEDTKRVRGRDPDLHVHVCRKAVTRNINRSFSGTYVCETPWLSASRFRGGPKTADGRVDYAVHGDGHDDAHVWWLHGSPRI